MTSYEREKAIQQALGDAPPKARNPDVGSSQWEPSGMRRDRRTTGDIIADRRRILASLVRAEEGYREAVANNRASADEFYAPQIDYLREKLKELGNGG